MAPETAGNESQHGSHNWKNFIPEGEKTVLFVDGITILLENWRETAGQLE